MIGKIKRKVKLEIDVDIDFNFNPKLQEAAIVGVGISDSAIISVRQVHAALQSGDYNQIDVEAKEILLQAYRDMAAQYAGRRHTDYPVDEFRSAPIHPGQWANEVRTACGLGCTTPHQLVVSTLKMVRVLLEPVFCRTPTVYVWSEDPAEDLSSMIEKRLPSMSNPTMEKMEDGSTRLKWPNLG